MSRYPLECVCTGPGICEARGRDCSKEMFSRCQTDARYRYLLSGIPRTEWPAELQPVPKPAKKPRTPTRKTPKPISLPVCVHRVPGTESSRDPTGQHNPCGKCHTHECEVHGVCTTGTKFEGVACCAGCLDYARPWVRHLIYFVYPVAGNGTWQRNLDQLFQRIDLFNGTRTIAISTDCGLHKLDPPEAVEEYVAGRAETFRVPARGKLGEVTAFVPLWERLRGFDGPEHCTFYAHTKGVTKPVNDGISVHRWADLMYAANLDHWEDVAELLERKPIVGAFKKLGPCFRRRADWHYTGTFYWCRNADVFARNWRKVRARYGGTELWPGQMFDANSAGCVFYEGAGYSLYSVPEVERAEQCYRAWPMPDRDGVSERERHRKVVDDAMALDCESLGKSGDGIVMLAGGRFDADSYVALRMLRDTGCKLPVKLYHHSTQPVSDQVRGIDGVTVMPFDNLHSPFPTRRGWEWKEVAIGASGFRRAMWLDADAYPVVDPTPRFNDLDETGVVFWWDIAVSEAVFMADVYGVADADRHYMRTPQAGVFLIDTVRHAKALAALRRLNEHSGYFYSVSYSDQELMRCIWTRLKLPFTSYSPEPVPNLGGNGHYLHNHVGPDGETFVVHRTGYKFGLRPERVDHVPGESRAWAFFDEWRARSHLTP